jgi:hypothetical protein
VYRGAFIEPLPGSALRCHNIFGFHGQWQPLSEESHNDADYDYDQDSLKRWPSSNNWDANKSKFHSRRKKSTLNSRNACLVSGQNLLSSRMLFKNLNMKMYRTRILPWHET